MPGVGYESFLPLIVFLERFNDLVCDKDRYHDEDRKRRRAYHKHAVKQHRLIVVVYRSVYHRDERVASALVDEIRHTADLAALLSRIEYRRRGLEQSFLGHNIVFSSVYLKHLSVF